jgi:hypothetical protein
MMCTAGLIGLVLLFTAWNEATRPIKGPHGRLELALLRGGDSLIWVQGAWFTTAGRCAGCHGHDPAGIASIDAEGNDINLVDDWRSTMQAPDIAGSVFTGHLEFDSARVYGPYHEDQIHPEIMADFVGFTPGFGAHMVDSRNCAGCHTLITPTLDLGGQPTGGEFVEQATYHEWLNSSYPANGVQCNTCHMPRTDDPIILAADYLFLNPQTPFGKHHLVGGNVHMLELMKEHRGTLGIPATATQFDSTIARTRRLLEQHSVHAEVMLLDRDADTARFALRLQNLTGHRFPSGYPARRAFVTFVVLDQQGDTLFKSGVLRSDLEVEGYAPPYAPHHDLITSADQVQIYEMVMGDVAGSVTTVLERAAAPLKDNRLPPVGFTSGHISYDTTRIAGVPPTDMDFNLHADGTEGSGADVVRYHVPTHGHQGGLRVHAAVYYQPLPPAWLAPMLAHSTPEIDAFRDMLSTSDGTPVRVAIDSLEIGGVGVAEMPTGGLRVFPNPTTDGRVRISPLVPLPLTVDAVYDATGRRMPVEVQHMAQGVVIELPARAGTYLVQLTVNGNTRVVRVVRR